MHQAMCRRLRGHGGCTLEPPDIVRAEAGWCDHPFGLGYYDGPGGELSHFFFGSAKGEFGPYTIHARAYENHTQLLELLALLKSLGDQVSSVEMLELGDVQFQDLLRQPIRARRNSEGSKFENYSEGLAPWQLRILDLESCLRKTRLRGEELSFNLALVDPVAEHLPSDSEWRGIGGDWVVTLGPESSASRGCRDELPILRASVGAFSRLWFGVRPATSLVVSDRLAGPEELLERLDDTVRVPSAHLGWDF